MNNKSFEKLINAMQSIRMTDNERNEMRNHLVALSRMPIQSPYVRFFSSFRRGVAITAIAILSLGSITNIVSGEALPGDMLYSVKITHEEIKRAVTFKPTEKAEYEIKRTGKRIQEATKLVQREQLSEKQELTISKSIQVQIKDIQKGIEKIKESNPEKALELQETLRVTLETNAHLLKEIVEQKNHERQEKEIINQEEPLVETAQSEGEEPLVEDKESLLSVSVIAITEVEDTKVNTLHGTLSAEILLGNIAEEMEKVEERKKEITREWEERKERITESRNHEPTDKEINDLEEDISAIQSIIDVQNDIEKLEDETKERELNEEVAKVIESFKNQSKKLIEEGKYERALEVLKELFLYQNEHSQQIETEGEVIENTNIEENNPHGISITETASLDTQTLSFAKTKARLGISR